MQRRIITLFEFGMVASLVGWVMSLESSRFEARRFAQNELRASIVLQAIRESQEVFRRDAKLDRNGDGTAEYGFLVDILEAAPAREVVRGLHPIGRGVYETADSAYAVSVFLPDESGRGVGEADDAPVSPREAAQCFVAYAWPAAYSRTGLRAFCIFADGRFLITENAIRQYSGRRCPAANAAMFAKEERLCGPNATSKGSNDRQPWSAAP